MNAVLQPEPDVLARLPAVDAPWRFDFEAWPHAEAQRWRAAMAVSARGRLALLADRPLEPLLRLRIESRLQRAVLWWPCSVADVDAALQAGEAGYRALGALAESFAAAGADESTQQLSALHLAEQASPVVRLLDATLHDALQDGASDIHFECTLRGLRIRSRIDGVCWTCASSTACRRPSSWCRA
jgi:general secretion pathway protein E